MLFFVPSSSLDAQFLPSGGGDGSAGDEAGGSDGRILLDGIAATVGSEIILISEVVQQTLLMKGGLGSSMPNAGELEGVLSDLIINKLLYVKAVEDSIELEDNLLTQQVDAYVGRLVTQAGSESSLETRYDKTMSEIRAEVRPIVREQLIIEMLQRRQFFDLKVTTRDIEAFYEIYRDSLPQVPEQVEIAHIFIETKPNDAARQNAFTLGNAIADSLRDGGIFGEYARRYSVDPGSARKGGELDWVPYGAFVSEYEAAVRELGINEISDPVESKFGLHIIQLLDREEDRFRSRHVLLPFRPAESTIAATIDTLRMISDRVTAGEDFGALARTYSDDGESAVRNGSLGRLPVTELGPLTWIVDSLSIGEVSTPRPFTASPTERGYHIVRLVDIIAPHAVDPKKDRDQIEGLARRWKQSRELVGFIEDLRKEIYWEILHDFQAGG